MNLFYKLAYAVGLKPWEQASENEAARITAMFDREQVEREPPYGKALDLGCGTGMQAVDLARRGWQVTGVDLVPKALRAARQRAQAAGLDINFVNGDVTALRDLTIGSGFNFVLDFGLFRGLSDAQRAAMGREVTAVAAPDASLLMIAWMPGRRPPLPRGAGRADIEAAFPGWTVIAEDAIRGSALPLPLKNAGPRLYRLRRASGPQSGLAKRNPPFSFRQSAPFDAAGYPFWQTPLTLLIDWFRPKKLSTSMSAYARPS